MKKLLAFILSATMLMGLAGCVTVTTTTTEEEIPLATTAATEQSESETTEESLDETEEETVAEETTAEETETSVEETTTTVATAEIDEDGTYDSAEDVALYLYTYGHLPSNYITKKEAKALGWSGGSVEDYAPGKCIGGDYFGNYEGLLPEEDGREYHECDIDTLGASSRGPKRIIYSNDGLIYYTEDHYESFTLLYGEE